MTYRIDLSSIAKAEADAAFLNLSQYTAIESARVWYQGLIKAISSLETMPYRCSIARENAFFSREIRQLLYGQGKNTYRIIFTVLDDQPIPTVRILNIRSTAQRVIGEVNDSDE
jgi:hypothetical protein